MQFSTLSVFLLAAVLATGEKLEAHSSSVSVYSSAPVATVVPSSAVDVPSSVHPFAPVASATGIPKPSGNSTDNPKPSGTAVPSPVPEGKAAMVLPGMLSVLAVVAAGMVVM